MSEKRAAAESSSIEQTNEGPDPASQQENSAKRAKQITLSDTTLQDLPVEMLAFILAKAVAMEVKDLKLAKSVWKEKVDLVIRASSLRNVCLQWNSILTTNFFRNEVGRILDDTAEETIRLEILHEFGIKPEVSRVTTMKDEIFLLLNNDYVVNVYNRNNMEEVKNVIELPRAEPWFMAACNVSNCVYVGQWTVGHHCLSVLRITKEEENQFKISPWIKDDRLPIDVMRVSANGSLIIVSHECKLYRGSNVISIYNANGSLQHRIILSRDIDVEVYQKVMQKSNGNIVLAYIDYEDHRTTLVELETSGSQVRKYKSSCSEDSSVDFADAHGRFVISEPFERMELLDSEFNLLGVYSLQQDYKGEGPAFFGLHYESERNEIMRIHYDRNNKTKALTVFRFTDK